MLHDKKGRIVINSRKWLIVRSPFCDFFAYSENVWIRHQQQLLALQRRNEDLACDKYKIVSEGTRYIRLSRDRYKIVT